MRRRTRLTEHILRSLRMDDWVQAQRRRKWTYAGHIMRREDSRWSNALLTWLPEHGFRTRGRPKIRWAQVFDNFFKLSLGVETGSWMMIAAERTEWKTLEADFVNFEDH